MKKQLLSLALLLFMHTIVYGQHEEVVTFKFVPGDDMFYIPWQGNGEQLNALYALVDQYRSEISSGDMPVHVDSYSASMKERKRNAELAFIRANRVKSELITHKGLVEDNFITRNYTTAFTDADGSIHKNMVVVTLHIPVREVDQIIIQAVPEDKPAPQPWPEPADEREQAAQPSQPAVETPTKPYCFAVRTNLLYDAFLLPTLGVEWRATENLGFKIDGSRSEWGDEHGEVQKIWMLSPEVRWYMLENKRFYVGVAGNFGEANIYKGLLGNTLNSIFSDDTGYQGDFWNVGLSAGYQLRLSRIFSLDLNIGAGYSSFEYDTFTVTDGTRIAKSRDNTKSIWGLTQAGVSLVWKIGK